MLFEKKLTVRNLQKIDEILSKVQTLNDENSDKYDKVSTRFKDGWLKVVGEWNTEEGVDGIPANVKYFKCDWTPRKPEEYLLSNALCLHIREMIELQHGIEVDNVRSVLILNKADYCKYVMDDSIYPQIENIWVNQNIIFNSEEMERLNALGFKYIPREFFGQELREAAE